MPPNRNTIRQLGIIALLVCIGFFSYWITIQNLPKESPPLKETPTAKETASSPIPKTTSDLTKAARPDSKPTKQPAEDETALKNLRSITFTDEESMKRFLARLGNGVTLLGTIDSLNTALVSFKNIDDLEALLDGTEETSLIYPVNIPSFESVGAQANAQALGRDLLKWLGVEGNNSDWGKGLVIAVLDTGIADHSVFRNAIQHINLVPLPANLADQNAHGTAVASLIFSSNSFAPGVAPGATPLSVRIADDNGSSNSFLIAQGIIAAADAGASIINISMGGTGNSNLVNKALEYSRNKGIVVVASSGNSGTEGVMQPAAQPSVIAVGAVDAQNQHLNFSTTGSQLAVSAPGYKVNAAYPGESAAQVNGTSFSAPIITGAIAATMSHSGKVTSNPQQAASLLLSNLKDVGIYGNDTATGGGVPDMWSVLNSGKRNIHDASINSIYINDKNQIQVLVQNLGTETLVNAGVTINVNGTVTNTNITTLAPKETRLISVPSSSSSDLNIKGTVRLSTSQIDQRASNDSISTQIIRNP